MNTCPTCRTPARATDRFCGRCFMKLPGLVAEPDRPVDALEPSTSEELDRMLREQFAGPPPIEPEVLAWEQLLPAVVGLEPQERRETTNLHRVLVFAGTAPEHWLFVTCGLAPWGFELTLRAPRTSDAPPEWGSAVLDTAAGRFKARAWLPSVGDRPRIDSVPGLPKALVARDPRHSKVSLDDRSIEVWTLCGLTAEEASLERPEELLARLASDPLLQTIPNRPTRDLPPVTPLQLPRDLPEVTRAWMRIEHWLETQERWSTNALAPGASPERLRRFEEALHVRLPDEVRESYLRHDGEGEYFWLFSPFCLLSLDDVEALAGELRTDNDRKLRTAARTAGWLSLLRHEDEAQVIFIDTSPRSETSGALVAPTSFKGVGLPFASSLTAYLATLADQMESGQLELTREGVRRVSGER